MSVTLTSRVTGGYMPVTAASGASVGLFETDADLRNYILRIDAQIEGMEKDILNAGRLKYGPSVYTPWATPSTVTAEMMPQFRKDRDFYEQWSLFRKAWKSFKEEIDGTYFVIASAKKYREAEEYDIESKAWRVKFKAQGIGVTAPTTTTPGAIPGITPPTNPDAPKSAIPKAPWDIFPEDIPWKKIGLFAGIGLVGYLILSNRGSGGTTTVVVPSAPAPSAPAPSAPEEASPGPRRAGSNIRRFART